MTIRLIVPVICMTRQKTPSRRSFTEDFERPPFLVHASLQHEEDGIGVEDNEIENEGRGEKAARRQSYRRGAQGARKICG